MGIILKQILLVIIAIVVIAAIATYFLILKKQDLKGFCGWSTYGKCTTDKDCIKSGCSGEVCQSRFEEPVITPCQYKECYNPEKYNVKCKCINNKCQWAP